MIECPHCGRMLTHSVNWIEHSKNCRVTTKIAITKEWCVSVQQFYIVDAPLVAEQETPKP